MLSASVNTFASASASPVRPGAQTLCFRGLAHIYAQVIDDSDGRTLVAASTLDKEVKDAVEFGGNIAAAKENRQACCRACKGKSIDTVVFDRGGYIYHGRVAALADAAREAGLSF